MNKNWITRFALFAILGSVLSSALLVGCGGGDEEDATANTAATDKTPKDEE